MSNINNLILNSSSYDFGGGTGLSDEAKQALLACFQQVAWIGDDGQDYYDALENALYPPNNLVSISAVYTQSGTVYDTDTLNSLKSGLVVTATYSDQTTGTVTAYTLSGSLEVGTSIITVSYGGKTATFTVTVTLSGQWVSLIDNDISKWYYHGNASYQNDTVIIAPTSEGWDDYTKPYALFQYSAIKNKRVRISGTAEITGYTGGKGFGIGLGTFSGASGTTTRKAYVNIDNTQAYTTGWLTQSGTFEFDTENLTMSDVLDKGTTPNDSEWVNAIVYLSANSGCVAQITNVTIEYLD